MPWLLVSFAVGAIAYFKGSTDTMKSVAPPQGGLTTNQLLMFGLFAIMMFWGVSHLPKSVKKAFK